MKFVKHRRLGGAVASMGDGTEYNFIPKNDIAIAKVEDNHVGELLIKQCGCCGSEYRCFELASEADVILWQSEG